MKKSDNRSGSGKTMQIGGLASLFLLLVFTITFAQAQSLSVITFDSIVQGDASVSTALYAHASVKNNSAEAIDVKVKRIDGNFTKLTDFNAICWASCHPPEVSVSNLAITIGPGEIDSLDFTGHVFPDQDGVPANGDITYVFFDENNPADSVAMTVHYEVVAALAVPEESNDYLVEIIPNPASNFISLNLSVIYSEPLIFKLYSSFGRLVYADKFSGLNKSNLINISSLPSGRYIYTLSEDSRILKTGKLIIQ